jgi:hypothetical protein
LDITILYSIYFYFFSGKGIFRKRGLVIGNNMRFSNSRGCRGQPSNRKWSDKSKKVSFNSTPILDTKNVPIAAKLPDTSSPLSSPNL